MAPALVTAMLVVGLIAMQGPKTAAEKPLQGRKIAEPSRPNVQSLPPPVFLPPPPEIPVAPAKHPAPKTDPASPNSSAEPVKRQARLVQRQLAEDPETGRALLRQLEAGSGPSIEIAWPESRREQEQLYTVFRQCYGMVSAILGDDGSIIGMPGASGSPAVLNRDRYSGYARQPAGQSIVRERRELADLRQRHRVRTGAAIRLFPRHVDAWLLGNLFRMINADYRKNVSIKGRYRLSDTIVQIYDITAGGRPVSGSITLPPQCRRTASSRL